MSPYLTRIDPRDCGCTDCITGYSRPLSRATFDDVLALMVGQLDDATGVDWEAARRRMDRAAKDELVRFLHEGTRP